MFINKKHIKRINEIHHDMLAMEQVEKWIKANKLAREKE